MRGLDIVGIPTPNLQEFMQSPGFSFFPVVREMSALSVSAGTTVTAHATIHTKGAWTELIAATTIPASYLLVWIGDMFIAGTDTRALLDIGFGAVASEVVKVADIPAGFTNTIGPAASPPPTLIPIDVPVGTRIAARLQALITVDTANVVVATATGQRVGIRSPSAVDTIGADTAASKGVNLLTDNTYVEIIAATTQAYRALVMLPCGGTGTNYAAENSIYTLAVGASGSEVALGTAIVRTGTSETLHSFSGSALIPGHFPKGCRVACKQSVGRAYRDVIVIGIPYV